MNSPHSVFSVANRPSVRKLYELVIASSDAPTVEHSDGLAMAAEMGMSPRSFHRHFTAAMGDTPVHVFERLRLDRARSDRGRCATRRCGSRQWFPLGGSLRPAIRHVAGALSRDARARRGTAPQLKSLPGYRTCPRHLNEVLDHPPVERGNRLG